MLKTMTELNLNAFSTTFTNVENTLYRDRILFKDQVNEKLTNHNIPIITGTNISKTMTFYSIINEDIHAVPTEFHRIDISKITIFGTISVSISIISITIQTVIDNQVKLQPMLTVEIKTKFKILTVLISTNTFQAHLNLYFQLLTVSLSCSPL